MGEAGEHSPKPTNWRGTTTRRSLTELRLYGGDQLRLYGGDQLRTVHGRETCIEAKMARPLGPSQEVPQRVREQGGTPTRIAQTPECDEASKQSGTTGRSQVRGARSNQTTRPAKLKPMRGSHDNPGRERPGEDREAVNSTRSRERTERPHPHGNLNSFLEELRHWIRQKSTVRPRGARTANPKNEIAHKRLNSTRTE